MKNDKVLLENELIAKKLNNFFNNAVSTLNIKKNIFVTNKISDDLIDPIEKTIEKYKFRSSI